MRLIAEIFVANTTIKISWLHFQKMGHLEERFLLFKPLSNFTEITLRHGCSLVNLLHIFRTPFFKNMSRRLLLKVQKTFPPRNQTSPTPLFQKFQNPYNITRDKPLLEDQPFFNWFGIIITHASLLCVATQSLDLLKTIPS